MRKVALRARGFASNSFSPAVMGLRVMRRTTGFLPQTHTGMFFGQVQGSASVRKAFLTMRSSREWKAMTHSLPPVSYTHLDVYKRQLYKMAAFALRAVYFCRTGEYIFRTDDLRERLTPPEARLLDGVDAARALTDDSAPYEELCDRLRRWAADTICDMGDANANDT